MYNSSIQQSIFPGYFKVAVIKPLLKSEDCKNMNNYRPISFADKFFKNSRENNQSQVNNFFERKSTVI